MTSVSRPSYKSTMSSVSQPVSQPFSQPASQPSPHRRVTAKKGTWEVSYVMSSGAIDHIKRCARVIIALRVTGAVGEDRVVSLVDVHVALHDHVNAVVLQNGGKGGGAVRTRRSGDKPGSVSQSDDPGSLATVNGREVVGKPLR